MTQSTISFQDVSKSFDGGVKALDGVSLDVAQGEFLAIVGGSGSGKTTLLRVGNGLIAPDRGCVLVMGQDVAESDPVQLRRGIGYVVQNGGLFPHLSVGDNIGITPRLTGEAPNVIAERVRELMALVQLDPIYATRQPHELSGGQRQRVGVARALAASPKIVLMDEPFGALDPLTRDALGEDYRTLHRKLGLTTVMITHDIAEALLLADRIAVMHKGTLMAQGSAGELARTSEPYVAELLRTPKRQAERLQQMLSDT